VLPTAAAGVAVNAVDEVVAILFGHAEQVGDDQQGERAAKPLMNSPFPGARNESSIPSASTHIASSFSLSRLGVINRISNARWLV